MEKKTVTAEELEKAFQYLDTFMKGNPSEPVKGNPDEKDPEKPAEPSQEPTSEEEPEDELYVAHKKRLAAYLDKAMSHKSIMDMIKKGDPLPDSAFEDLDDEGSDDEGSAKPAEPMKKGNDNELSQDQIGELVKAKVAEALSAQKSESESIIKSLQDQIARQETQISQLQEIPIRKTIIKGADALTLKKALSGEKVDDKTVLSISLQKSKVSDVLFEAFEGEKDEIVKGRIGEAIAEFEATGEYISPEVAQIMEKKGYTFVK